MRINKLLSAVKDGILVNERFEMEIDALFFNSREKVENGLYFCLTGGKVDGHFYAEEAIANGAVALVVERRLPYNVPQIIVSDTREAMGMIASAFYGFPSERVKVIGITGTNGKTTTAHMLASILETDGKKVGIIGTLGAKYDNKVEDTGLTTPDPIAFQRLLAKMSAFGITHVVAEISAHALYYKKTAGIRFCACVFTNVSQDHLDFFSTMESYKKVKKELFLDDVCPIAVLNGDESFGREIGKNRKKKSVYYGLTTPTDAFALVTDENLFDSSCVLNINDVLCSVKIRMTGRHNVYNALASATCALALGVTSEAITRGLERMQGVCGRLEYVAKYHGAEIFVDYAHTPDGIEKSLSALRPHCQKNLICLFGCGGNRDKSKRKIMGERVAKYCDFAILTSDNPRYEDPLDIISQIEKGYRPCSKNYVVIADRAEAIAYALTILKKGDVLLVCGKGGEEYQEIMGIKHPFNDKDIIEKNINGDGK